MMTVDVQKKAEELAERILKNFNANEAAELVIACKTKASRSYERALEALVSFSIQGDRGLSTARFHMETAEFWDLVDGIISRKIGNIP